MKLSLKGPFYKRSLTKITPILCAMFIARSYVTWKFWCQYDLCNFTSSIDCIILCITGPLYGVIHLLNDIWTLKRHKKCNPVLSRSVVCYGRLYPVRMENILPFSISCNNFPPSISNLRTLNKVKSALRLTLLLFLWMTSRKRVGRSCMVWVKIWRRYPSSS